jgi:hypothetical protein
VKLRAAVLLLWLLCGAGRAHALDGVSAEFGQGHGIWLWRLGAQWNGSERWTFRTGNWHGRVYWDVNAGVWEQGVDTIYDLGVTPVVRLEHERPNGSPYLELGIGPHMLSNLAVTPYRTFTTHLQFGDHIGAGLRFGDEERYDIGVRLQHISNAGIQNPNPGINFLQLRLQYHYH